LQFHASSTGIRIYPQRRTTNCEVQSDDRTQHQKHEKVAKNLARALIAGAAFLLCARDYRAHKYRDNQKRKGMI
jgi:hypothetical protein